MNDNLEIRAKLTLDTDEAESKIAQISKTQKSGEIELSLPKDTEIKLPEKTKESLANLFKGDKGLENVSKVAEGASKGFNGLLGSLKSVTAGAKAATLAIGVAIAAIAVIVKLLQGTDTMRAMQQALERLMTSFREVLAPVLALVGEIVIVLADSFASLAPILEAPVKIIANILNFVVGILKVLQPFIELLGKFFEVMNAISSIFTELVGGIMTSLFEIIIQLVDIALKPLFWVLDKLISFFDMVKEAIQNFITKLTFGLVTFNKTSLASTEAVKADLKTSLDTWETSGKETESERAAREAAEASLSAAENMEGASGGILDGIGTFLEDLGSGLKSVISDVGSALKNTWDGIKDGVVNAWDKVKETTSNVWNSVKDGVSNAWSKITTKASNSWEKLKGVTSNLLSKAGNFLSDAIQGTKNIIGNIVGKTKDFASNIGKTVGNALGNVKTGAVNLFSKLKFWDSGGTLSQGAQIWGMSERGNPEFIFNAGGHNTVINADILENAMVNALIKAGTGKAQRLEVSVKEGIAAGPREMAQMLLPSLRFLLKGG